MTLSKRIRDAIYYGFQHQGVAPSIGELAATTGASTAQVTHELHLLAAAHAVVLNSAGDAVRMAHPFSNAPMGFVLYPTDGSDRRMWWGGCAWDSFGISAALKLEVRIETHCPYCHTRLSYVAGPNAAPPTELAIRFPKPASQWWDDVVDTCSHIFSFCTTEHAAAWTEQFAPGAGYITSATTIWGLAQEWYGDRLDPDFSPHTKKFNQALLTACGLEGDFWRLP